MPEELLIYLLLRQLGQSKKHRGILTLRKGLYRLNASTSSLISLTIGDYDICLTDCALTILQEESAKGWRACRRPDCQPTLVFLTPTNLRLKAADTTRHEQLRVGGNVEFCHPDCSRNQSVSSQSSSKDKNGKITPDNHIPPHRGEVAETWCPGHAGYRMCSSGVLARVMKMPPVLDINIQRPFSDVL